MGKSGRISVTVAGAAVRLAGDPFGPGCRAPHRASASRVSALRASIPIAAAIAASRCRVLGPTAAGDGHHRHPRPPYHSTRRLHARIGGTPRLPVPWLQSTPPPGRFDRTIAGSRFPCAEGLPSELADRLQPTGKPRSGREYPGAGVARQNSRTLSTAPGL